jgi:hypothetical protein
MLVDVENFGLQAKHDFTNFDMLSCSGSFDAETKTDLQNNQKLNDWQVTDIEIKIKR